MNKIIILMVAVTSVWIHSLTAHANAPILFCDKSCAELKYKIAQIGNSPDFHLKLFDSIRLNFVDGEFQKMKNFFDSKVLLHVKCFSDNTNMVQNALNQLYTELIKNTFESFSYLMVVGGASFIQISAWERYREEVPALIEDLCNMKKPTIQQNE